MQKQMDSAADLASKRLPVATCGQCGLTMRLEKRAIPQRLPAWVHEDYWVCERGHAKVAD
jgi:hypothetical protein